MPTVNRCRFNQRAKVLTISIDDLDAPLSRIQPLIEYLHANRLPVTLFPHSGANPVVLQRMLKLNAKVGWHGRRSGELDRNPIRQTNRAVIAWSFGVDREGRKETLDANMIARGVRCNRNKRWGEFDQHDLPSCSIGHYFNRTLNEEARRVLNEGGVLSVHLHNADGLASLRRIVRLFQTHDNAWIEHLDQLVGCGRVN